MSVMVIIPMAVISMSSLVKKEKYNLGNMIKKNKEIITLIICSACFYHFVKHLNSLLGQHLFKMINLVIFLKEIG